MWKTELVAWPVRIFVGSLWFDIIMPWPVTYFVPDPEEQTTNLLN
jgi:hypothetical protein